MVVTDQSYIMTVGENKNKFQYKSDAVAEQYNWPFIRKNFNEQQQKYSNKVKIYLTEYGFQLGYGVKRLVPYHFDVKQGSYEWMIWANRHFAMSPANGPYASFSFVPVDQETYDHKKGFRIRILKENGNVCLIANRASVWPWTKLISTTV